MPSEQITMWFALCLWRNWLMVYATRWFDAERIWYLLFIFLLIENIINYKGCLWPYQKKSVMVSAKVTTVLFLFVIFLLLFFRNSLYFTYSAPHAEDFGIFLREEYIIGFPNTVFILFAGYIHLLPRIISLTFPKNIP